MNKAFIIEVLKNCKTWEEGQVVIFKYKDWELVLRKEELIYSPFSFSINGKKCNSNETIGRRYINAERAFLHVLNGFNENANVKNQYETLDDALKVME